MHKHLRLLFLLGLLLVPFSGLLAFSNPPANDSVNNAFDLGYLAPPGLCPNAPKGDFDSLTGTTNNATYNLEQFSSLHIFSQPSPDVWYKFHATGAFIYIELTGSSGLNNFFIKIHYSEGSAITLLPGQCASSTGGFLAATFPTPTLNGEYYLEIGGDTPSETGDFFMKYKAFNDCSGCVKKATMDFSPAPVFGRYNAGDTVTMCLTVDRWESLTTSYLHGIVPTFGSDWDMTSLTPLSAPVTAGVGGGYWSWFTNIPTPNGNGDGYFFEATTDNNPSNNAGDHGNVLSSWKGCWKIRALTTCNTDDLSVQINMYSDAETGNGNIFSVCGQYDALEVGTASSCCVAPVVHTSSVGSCANSISTITVYAPGTTAAHTFNYFLLDTDYIVIQSAMGVVGPTNFINVAPGQYIVWSVDLSNGNCTSYKAVKIEQLLSAGVAQTSTGCGSGTGQAIATAVGGSAPYSYLWLNVSSVNQLDSAAFNLPDGWAVVSITDSAGCSVVDSVLITSVSQPDPWFTYGGVAQCAGVDTIPVTSAPASQSGTFTLVSPQSAGITVDPATGMIFTAASTLSPPYYIFVNYSINGLCPVSYTDSIQVVAVPAAPLPVGNAAIGYCPGDPAPVLTVTVPSNTVATWYDSQFNFVGFGNTYTPPINGSTAPGTYVYGVVDVSTGAGNCTSAITFFVINVSALPVITTSNDTALCPGDTATLVVSGCPACTILWTPSPTSGNNSAQQTFTAPSASTSYVVYATDGSGCSSSGSVNVTINNCSQISGVNIYHGLTPNGDGHNDTWYIDGIDSLSGCRVTIFNRWGMLIWEGNNYDNSRIVFDGRDQQGHPLSDGTYYYIINLGDQSASGWIELSH